MKRLLVLATAPPTAAATRFRLQQFFPALRASRIEPTLRPFLDEDGFSVLYHRGARAQKIVAALRAIAGRLSDLVRATRADGVLVHREAALVGPPLIEWLLARVLRLPLIFDFDDAIWVPYVSPTYGALLSRLLKAPWKTSFTLAAATRVIAGNSHVAEYARRFSRTVEIIPTVVDTDRFCPAERRNGLPVLGWIGTPSSIQYLRPLVPILRRLADRRAFVLRVVGGALEAPGVPVEHHPWSLDREVAEFQSIDIGLYPLAEDEWARGKSGFKAVQYMSCGVPMVASPVGVTAEMVRDGHNGFLVKTDDEWMGRIEALIADAALRDRLGRAGRTDAVAHWSLTRYAPRFVEVVASALENS